MVEDGNDAAAVKSQMLVLAKSHVDKHKEQARLQTMLADNATTDCDRMRVELVRHAGAIVDGQNANTLLKSKLTTLESSNATLGGQLAVERLEVQKLRQEATAFATSYVPAPRTNA